LNETLYLNLGRLYVSLGERAKARDVIERLLARKPGDPMATRVATRADARPLREGGCRISLAGACAILIPVQITLEVPDEFASPLLPAGQDPARAALEAMALEAYREHRLTGYQLRQLLGISSRYELDGFLKQHQVWLEYSLEDFERERAISEQLWQKRQAEHAKEADHEHRAG